MGKFNFKVVSYSLRYELVQRDSFGAPAVVTDSRTTVWEPNASRYETPMLTTRNIFEQLVPVPYNQVTYKPRTGLEWTYSIIKADVGGIGGHVIVSEWVARRVLQYVLSSSIARDIASVFVVGEGDDVSIHMFHQRGPADEGIHRLSYNALWEGGGVALYDGLYGPRQDLPVQGRDKFLQTGNVSGAGPSVAEINLDPSIQNAVVVAFMADKTDPGSFNRPFSNIYGTINLQDASLLADSTARNGWYFLIEDVELLAAAKEQGISPDELSKKGHGYILVHSSQQRDVLVLLSDPDRYAIKAIYATNNDGTIGRMAAVVSTDKLHNIPGLGYGGKDDPVAAALAQKAYPAPGEIMRAGWLVPPIVAGNCRGSHFAWLYPSPLFGDTAFSSGPILTSATISFSQKFARVGGIVDNFAGSQWDDIRRQTIQNYVQMMLAQGPIQPHLLPLGALEYQTGFMRDRTRLQGSTQYTNAAYPHPDLLASLLGPKRGVEGQVETGVEVEALTPAGGSGTSTDSGKRDQGGPEVVMKTVEGEPEINAPGGSDRAPEAGTTSGGTRGAEAEKDSVD